ncbi:nucleoside diphosphate-linked moiety X motif 8 isoform X1 [Sarcophilus harrisii]|uniref:nucleoside diphosphate-linked moiety X motif 8 isoform X1 n=1 Tax=Sarcophilus harrisii TaxID=9305 RepID=UPI0013020B76|nr:nucleoside diphosphate-linked moiety X motif 8 isoform X1 [Sarcophilus harrisii]XP_031797596.1 nucleoside diphosphate-linked moiety X motif 8 isoform X1 [Sarcophilus harrisii]XP_031797597.1 nucleoside diphosphate-linked moiety X motif 8 isoform X1 [Sarcophilus harrisii]XP_031797598.1 nucleoside diphosphate-linked moiety X motif 8 isoform X1 [Sarcophilus harrisii]
MEGGMFNMSELKRAVKAERQSLKNIRTGGTILGRTQKGGASDARKDGPRLIWEPPLSRSCLSQASPFQPLCSPLQWALCPSPRPMCPQTLLALYKGQGMGGLLMLLCLSFPGGKCDPQDQDIVDTALRETREELGLSIQEENVWGVMKPVDDGKNSIVVPVIAQVGPLESLDLTPNPQEVDDIFTMPLAHLLHPRNQGYTHFCRQGRYSYTLPIFLHGPYRVWGLTAIFTELVLEMLVPGTYRRRVHFAGQPRKGETRA